MNKKLSCLLLSSIILTTGCNIGSNPNNLEQHSKIENKGIFSFITDLIFKSKKDEIENNLKSLKSTDSEARQIQLLDTLARFENKYKPQFYNAILFTFKDAIKENKFNLSSPNIALKLFQTINTFSIENKGLLLTYLSPFIINPAEYHHQFQHENVEIRNAFEENPEALQEYLKYFQNIVLDSGDMRKVSNFNNTRIRSFIDAVVDGKFGTNIQNYKYLAEFIIKFDLINLCDRYDPKDTSDNSHPLDYIKHHYFDPRLSILKGIYYNRFGNDSELSKMLFKQVFENTKSISNQLKAQFAVLMMTNDSSQSWNHVWSHDNHEINRDLAEYLLSIDTSKLSFDGEKIQYEAQWSTFGSAFAETNKRKLTRYNEEVSDVILSGRLGDVQKNLISRVGLQNALTIMNDRIPNNKYLQKQGNDSYYHKSSTNKYNVFGKLDVYSLKNPEVPQLNKDLILDAITNVTSHSSLNSEYAYGSYGVSYSSNLTPDLLIVMAHAIDNEHSEQSLNEEMLGFLSLASNDYNEETINLYKHVLSYVKIYDLKNNPYAFPIDGLSSNSINFTRLPNWLKIIVQYIEKSNKINSKLYPAFIFVNDLPNGEMKTSITNAIRMVFSNKGGYITLNHDKKLDTEYKNQINIFLNEYYSNKPGILDEKLNSLWVNLDQKNKFNLINLFSHLAKAGALGYHYGENQSNELFARLALMAAKKLNSEQSNIRNLQEFINGINNGACIGALINSLNIANHDIIKTDWTIS